MRTTVDLTNISLSEFVDFVFDKPVPELVGGEEPEPWYYDVETTFEPCHLASLYVELFRDRSDLLERFSDSQIDQGAWALHGPNLDCAASNVMWEPAVPLIKRFEVVRSMRHLFLGPFSRRQLEAAHMWWDSLAYDWHCGNRSRARGGEDEMMQDVMFETLSAILMGPMEHVQYAALHGLGHLHHPQTADLIAAWLERVPIASEQLRDYARCASRFEVM